MVEVEFHAPIEAAQKCSAQLLYSSAELRTYLYSLCIRNVFEFSKVPRECRAVPRYESTKPFLSIACLDYRMRTDDRSTHSFVSVS